MLDAELKDKKVIEYSLDGDWPAGTQIDAATGKITFGWMK